MVTNLSGEALDTLKNLIGQNLEFITAENWTVFNRSYGNILIRTNQQITELQNDYVQSLYFGDEEELAAFNVKRIATVDDFNASVMPENLFTQPIDELITSIKVVRDNIRLSFSDKNSENHIVDQAIIFELETKEWLIGQQFIFTPIADMVFGKGLMSKVRSIETITDEWTDDDEEGTATEVLVERQVIEL